MVFGHDLFLVTVKFPTRLIRIQLLCCVFKQTCGSATFTQTPQPSNAYFSAEARLCLAVKRPKKTRFTLAAWRGFSASSNEYKVVSTSLCASAALFAESSALTSLRWLTVVIVDAPFFFHSRTASALD